ncbi:MAG: hypothetical protein ABSC76_04945 [Terracidiphilus sp.]|jgi:hypothetical protein
MLSRSCFFSATLGAGLVLLMLSGSTVAQEPGSRPSVVAELPEAPASQFPVAAPEPSTEQAPDGQSQATPPPASGAGQSGTAQAGQGSSSSQTPTPPPAAEKSQHDKAEEQIKEQETQRVVGVLPQFNISYRSDAVSMTAGQKMKLAFRSQIDPVAFGAAFVVAGYHEALDDDTGFGWGIEGYGKRSGAAYLDAFDGTMIGNGILPSILHQDPRYFRLGHGTITHRLFYSLATNVMCKHDNTHKWEPNYSNVGGNIISGAISNLYYPSSNSGIGQTFATGFIVTAEGGIGSMFDEFWPDISRKFLHKDPTHGLDTQARAADQQKKESNQTQK